MSAFDPARPRYTLPFAGKDYELLGTFGLIEAVEYAMKEFIGRVAVRVVNGMPASDLAKLISALLTACDHKMTAKEAGDLLWNVVGIEGADNQKLRLHLYSFFEICIAPPQSRQKAAEKAGEMIGELTALLASRGSTTGESA